MRAPHHLPHGLGWGCWARPRWWKRTEGGSCAAADHGCCGGAAAGGFPSGEGLCLRCRILNGIPWCAGSGGWHRASSCQLRLSTAQLRGEPQEQKGSQSHGNMALKCLWSRRGRRRPPTPQKTMRRKRKKGRWSGRTACVAGGKAVLVPVQKPLRSPYTCGSSCGWSDLGLKPRLFLPELQDMNLVLSPVHLFPLWGPDTLLKSREKVSLYHLCRSFLYA